MPSEQYARVLGTRRLSAGSGWLVGHGRGTTRRGGPAGRRPGGWGGGGARVSAARTSRAWGGLWPRLVWSGLLRQDGWPPRHVARCMHAFWRCGPMGRSAGSPVSGWLNCRSARGAIPGLCVFRALLSGQGRVGLPPSWLAGARESDKCARPCRQTSHTTPRTRMASSSAITHDRWLWSCSSRRWQQGPCLMGWQPAQAVWLAWPPAGPAGRTAMDDGPCHVRSS